MMINNKNLGLTALCILLFTIGCYNVWQHPKAQEFLSDKKFSYGPCGNKKISINPSGCITYWKEWNKNIQTKENIGTEYNKLTPRQRASKFKATYCDPDSDVNATSLDCSKYDKIKKHPKQGGRYRNSYGNEPN